MVAAFYFDRRKVVWILLFFGGLFVYSAATTLRFILYGMPMEPRRGIGRILEDAPLELILFASTSCTLFFGLLVLATTWFIWERQPALVLDASGLTIRLSGFLRCRPRLYEVIRVQKAEIENTHLVENQIGNILYLYYSDKVDGKQKDRLIRVPIGMMRGHSEEIFDQIERWRNEL